jgi:hypothetical protein
LPFYLDCAIRAGACFQHIAPALRTDSASHCRNPFLCNYRIS